MPVYIQYVVVVSFLQPATANTNIFGVITNVLLLQYYMHASAECLTTADMIPGKTRSVQYTTTVSQ
jgi:hypothetical protein